MTQIRNSKNKTVEVADILHHHLDDYKAEKAAGP